MRSLTQDLRDLQLPGMADAWEAWHATPANVERGMDQCLAYLIDTQRQTSLQTRSDRFFRQAGLATHYSMQTFETGRASGLTPPVLDHLKGLSWIARGQAVVISGPALSGKTHLAAGIGQEAVIQGIRTTFIQTPRMLERCLDLAGHPAALRRYRRQLAIVPLLILDDFATEHSNTARTYELRRLIDERSRQCLPTVVASINDPRDWDGYFEDEAAREGIYARLIHQGAHRIQLQRRPVKVNASTQETSKTPHRARRRCVARMRAVC